MGFFFYDNSDTWQQIMKTPLKLILVAILLLPILSYGQKYKSDYQIDFNPIGGTKKSHHDVSIDFARKGAPPIYMLGDKILSSGLFLFNYDELRYNPIMCKLEYKDEKDNATNILTNYVIREDWAINFSKLKVKEYKASSDSTVYCINVNKSSYQMVFTLYRTAGFGAGYIIFYANPK